MIPDAGDKSLAASFSIRPNAIYVTLVLGQYCTQLERI